MSDENSSEYLDLIKLNTEFKTIERAKAVVETLKWLDAGAPETFSNLPGKFQFEMSCYLEDAADFTDNPNENRGCGTACCIAGAIYAFEKKGKIHLEDGDSICDSFDMNIGTKLSRLFLCDSSVALADVTAKGAATTLRRYIETGEVFWRLSEQTKED